MSLFRFSGKDQPSQQSDRHPHAGTKLVAWNGSAWTGPGIPCEVLVAVFHATRTRKRRVLCF